jgi:hypothetical protein
MKLFLKDHSRWCKLGACEILGKFIYTASKKYAEDNNKYDEYISTLKEEESEEDLF